MNQTETHKSKMKALLELAASSGATDARVISAGDIVIDDRLPDICRQTACEGYGRSRSCPPYVAGPSGFREWIKAIELAIVVKMDVPMEILLSEREDIMRLLHEVVASVELASKQLGYVNSKAFAGGSCKQLFCSAYADCRAVTGNGECRNPQCARPSMSGFGVNVAELTNTAGWSQDAEKGGGHERASTGTVSGLILIG